METVIACPQIILSGGRIIEQGLVVVEGDSIKRLDSGRAPRRGKSRRVYNFKAGVLHPGCVDLHVHGLGPYGVQQLRELSLFLANRGVTSFTPTLSAAQCRPEIVARVAALADAATGARVLGINLEGPFLNPVMAGAQDPASFKKPDRELLQSLLRAGDSRVRMMTLAPELPGSEEILTLLAAAGVIAAAGHSTAGLDLLQGPAGTRISHTTHLFNRSGTWHHRRPSLSGWSLVEDSVSAELVAEPSHLHPATVEMALRVKPADKVCLVSDSVSYDFTASPHFTGSAVFDRQGRLQGTSWSLLQSLYWAASRVEGGLPRLIPCAVANPCRRLGIEDRGDIMPGMKADLVVSQNGLSLLTMTEGRVVSFSPIEYR